MATLICGIALAGATAPTGSVAAAATTPDTALEVSFAPSASVRLRGQRFDAAGRPARTQLDDVLAGHDVTRVQRVFTTPEATLDATRRRLLGEGRRGVPDLNRHFRIVAGSRRERDRLIAALGALPAVDRVIAAPEPVPPPTADYTGQQRYGLPAPTGIGAGGLAGVDGGTGNGVKITDVEYSWNTAHEDLARAAGARIPNGTPVDPFSSTHHGTAVIGELVGTANAFGITGLAPDSELGLVNATSTAGYTLPQAVNLARQSLTAGDVMLLEQQYPVTPDGKDYVAAEYWPAVYDAIKLATQSGIIVVEAAGNGGVDLDDLDQPFPRGMPDSGAIVVGAGTGDCDALANGRMPYSSYGSRVNLQGWGQCVVTAGFGDLFSGGPNALYTQGFTGTSSAAPMAAAAAALFSSVFQATTGGRAPNPLAVRDRLIATGTPQGPGPSGHIGPLPNALAAATGFDFTPPDTTIGGGPAGPTSDTTPSFDFTASETSATFECRVVDVTAFAPCSSPFTAPALGDGTRTLEVRATDLALNPGAAAARAFTVDTVAPTTSIATGPTGVTSDATPTFAFTADEPGAVFACRIAGVTAFAPCASPFTAAALADGPAAFEVQATDAAQNAGPAAARGFTVDTTRPAAPAAPGATIAAPAFTAAGRLTVSVSGTGSVHLVRPKITCPRQAPACRVTARARLTTGRKAQIASATLTIATARSATIRFRLTKSARALLRRRGRLEATVVITARHGSRTSTRTVRLTLKRRR